MTGFLNKLQASFNSLLLHKLRTALAVLGIYFGVTAVIALVAMGEGVSYQAQQQIKDLGATNVIVRSVKPPQQSSRGPSSVYIIYGLLREDFERIVSNVPNLKQAIPMREIRYEIRKGDQVADSKLVGCTPEYLTLNHLTVDRGRFITDADLENNQNVAVIAEEAAKTLFPLGNPLGQSIQIGSDFYVVVGQTAPRAASAAIGGSLDARQYNQDVYIPLTTLRWRIGDEVRTARSGSLEAEIVELSQITLSVAEMKEVDSTAAIVTHLLEQNHETPDFAVVVPKELLQQAKMMQMMFNVLLVVIAGISLLVGGIGIMNIMLATVTERTREIGVRRAIGATQGDIVQQFLIETVMLSATGGVLGVACGFLCGPAVDGLRRLAIGLFPKMMAAVPPNLLNLQPRIATWSIFVAFGISVAVGVLFGLYPARRAAMMDPIEALRHE